MCTASCFLFQIQFWRLVQMLWNIFPVAFSLPDASCEQIFNLSVYGLEIVLCPGGDCLIERFI
jgi:hypothetical protein